MRSAALAIGLAKKARQKPRDLEGPIHREVLRFLRVALPAGFLVHHAANKPRSMRQGAREKAMGAVAGWPDLAIYGRRESDDAPSVWFVEIKQPKGTVEPHQRDVHDQLRDIGFPAVRIVRSVDDIRKAVHDWDIAGRAS